MIIVEIPRSPLATRPGEPGTLRPVSGRHYQVRQIAMGLLRGRQPISHQKDMVDQKAEVVRLQLHPAADCRSSKVATFAEAAPRSRKSFMRNSVVTPECTRAPTSRTCWPLMSRSWLKKISMTPVPSSRYRGLINWQITRISMS
jgi:hypothetical protein